MSTAPPPLLEEAQESRLIALLRGLSVDSAGLIEIAPAAGVAGAVAHILGDAQILALQELSHQRGLHWIRRAGEALDAIGVRFLVLKGIPLSERYYEPQFLRACGDLDILIHPDDFARADTAIRTCGFFPSTKVPNLTTRILGHDVTYDHPSAPALELHVRLQSFFGIRPDAARFLNRSIRQRLSNGYTVRVLEPIDEFVHLAAHAAAHRWSACRWLYDIVLLLQRQPHLDWEAVARRTGELRLWPAVLLTCVVLEEEWALPVPLAASAPDRLKKIRALLPSIRRSQWQGTSLEKTGYVFRELGFCHGPAEKLRFLARAFTYPVLRRFRDRLQ